MVICGWPQKAAWCGLTGFKFTVYDTQNTPALRSNNIRALFEDKQQALWIGTADGLTVFRSGGSAIFTREQGLPNNSIWSIEHNSAGTLSVLTASGLAEYRNGRFEAIEPKENVEGNSSATLKDRQGTRWVGNRGLERIANGKVETFPANDPLANETILSLFEDREGNFWLGSESNGVTILRDPKITTYSEDLARCVYQDRRAACGSAPTAASQNGLAAKCAFHRGERAIEQPVFALLVKPRGVTYWWARKMA